MRDDSEYKAFGTDVTHTAESCTVVGGGIYEGRGDRQAERAKGAGHTLSRHLNHLFLYSRHCHDLMAFLKAFDRPDLRSRDCTCQR
jgi:hypothetical protein